MLLLVEINLRESDLEALWQFYGAENPEFKDCSEIKRLKFRLVPQCGNWEIK